MSGTEESFSTEFGEFLDFQVDDFGGIDYSESFREFIPLKEIPIDSSEIYGLIKEKIRGVR